MFSPAEMGGKKNQGYRHAWTQTSMRIHDSRAFLVGGIMPPDDRPEVGAHALLSSHGDGMDKQAYPRWTRREGAHAEE